MPYRALSIRRLFLRGVILYLLSAIGGDGDVVWGAAHCKMASISLVAANFPGAVVLPRPAPLRRNTDRFLFL